MRKSKTLARIRENAAVRICALGHYIPAFICHAARAGYDCIWLDLEHRALTLHQIQALLAYSHLFDIDIMLRPPTLEKTELYRYLEDGATGVLIPHVSTAEKARMLVDALKFPPIGDRGIDNAGLDADFYLHDADEYVKWANQETFLVVQVETPQAVRNVRAIAAVEGVDGIFVGPSDLGLRLRQSGEMSLDEAFTEVAAACREHDVAWGCPAADRDERNKRREQGAQLLALSGDFHSFIQGLQEGLED
jgi:2-keto-3-deoxy-L-rhamnonate aldolase RhmA